MGYTSKVIIGVKSGKLSEEFENILRKHDFPIDNPDISHISITSNMTGHYLHIHRDPNDKTFYTFNYIKWYESNDWCKEIVDFLEAVQEVDDDKVFCVGLGEDGQIHSEIGHPYEYVEQVSEINLIEWQQF